MAALPTSGEISFGDIVGNRGVAESNVSIKRDQYRFFNVKDAKDVTNKVDIV